MEQKVIHCLPATLAQTVRIHLGVTPPPKVITSIFPHTAVQKKKETCLGALILQIPFLGKLKEVDPGKSL